MSQSGPDDESRAGASQTPDPGTSETLDDDDLPVLAPAFRDPVFVEAALAEAMRQAEADPHHEELLRLCQRYAGSPVPERGPLPPALDELYTAVCFAAAAEGTALAPRPIRLHRFQIAEGMLGGMGVVLKAWDPKLERWVALKLWQQAGEAAQEALLAEARMLAKLSHPNVVTIYETGVWRGHAYFVMEWIDGLDGTAWLEQLILWEHVRDTFLLAGDGLAAAHDAGIQHRDFKPANMLVAHGGRVVVADFGVAASLSGADGKAVPTITGTPAYMAPERLRGGAGDERSDQFSFCVALWRALYKVRPFPGTRPDELLAAMASGKLAHDPAADVPAWLHAVVIRGLAMDPDDRFPDMHALLEALQSDPSDIPPWIEETYGIGAGSIDDESFLHTPHAQARSRARAAGALASALVVIGVVLAIAVPASQPSSLARLQVNLEVVAVEPSAVAEQPCVVDGVDVEPDPVVTQVCRLIQLDEFEAANMLWERERWNRLSSDSEPTTIGHHTLTISATFLERAVEHQGSHLDKARTAAESARGWANSAAVHFPSGDPRLESIAAEAQRVGEDLTPLGD